MFKDLAWQQPYNDDVISYLLHTVVTTAEPTASPTAPSSLPWDAVPNFAVNNSWTIQNLQKKFGFTRIQDSGLIVTN